MKKLLEQLISRKTKQKKVLVAFTLAEVLITLAIIGVVAGLTIPSLLANTNEKSLNTADSVFQRRLGEALKVMNLQGTLAGQPDTETFVKELGRHMKITKICNGKTNGAPLTDCFVSEFTDDENSDPIKVTDLQSSDNLNKGGNYGSETIGVVFGNGTRALIAYNKGVVQDQFDNSNTTSPVRLTVPDKKLDKQAKVKLNTEALVILYDLQERKNNNVYGKNIKGINVTFGISKCANGATKYGDTCYLLDTSKKNWDNAVSFCAGKGMSLIPKNDDANYVGLATLMNDPNFKTTVGIGESDGWFWSATEFDASNAYYVDSSTGNGDMFFKIISNRVLCAGN